MADVEKDNLGPWKDADLEATTTIHAGLGADAGIPKDVRFRSNVVKLVRRRLALTPKSADLELPAIFLLRPSPPDEMPTERPKRVPMLDNGRHELNGKVWFVGAGPGSGHFVPFANDDDDLLFRFVTDDLNLGAVPAIVFDPRLNDPHLRHYPNGLNDVGEFEEITILSVQVTFAQVSEAVNRTYLEKMKTPDAQPQTAKLWKKASKWQPFQDAELRVQMYLEIALNSAFPTCTVRSEQSMPEGRIDIEIFENDANDRSIITQHGVLELKVLRSFGETGRKVSQKYTKEWIKSGVQQAAAYRDGKGAKWGALLCFDMRCQNIGDTESFKHVTALAKKFGVCLRRWFMYGTSAQLRSTLISV